MCDKKAERSQEWKQEQQCDMSRLGNTSRYYKHGLHSRIAESREQFE
jgi:hypothetical protein